MYPCPPPPHSSGVGKEKSGKDDGVLCYCVSVSGRAYGTRWWCVCEGAAAASSGWAGSETLLHISSLFGLVGRCLSGFLLVGASC
jgi:hypothetical protein